jgi:predicted DNA repair protein MutK
MDAAAERPEPVPVFAEMSSLNPVFLLPGALALNYFAPWAITPLLMAGGVYLCFEGYEKVHEMVARPVADSGAVAPAETDPKALEDARVAGAIRTDIILSAEIMAITLASVAHSPFGTQAAVLAVVGLGITALVYGAVALIVKADDFGVALARRGGAIGAIGVGIVKAMPRLLKGLSVVGMLAMLWVGGGIIVHGLEVFHVETIPHLIHDIAHAAAKAVPAIGPVLEWLVGAIGSAIVGLIVGGPIVGMLHLIPHKKPAAAAAH